jgi:hypothetical protein
VRSKRLWWVLGALIGLPVVLLALYVLMMFGFLVVAPTADDYSHRTAFESRAWRDRSLDQDLHWPTRLRMVDDLTATRRLDGLTRAELLTLLGPSDQSGKWRDWDLVYWLGPERGFMRIDSEWLVVQFDSSGRVAAYRIVRD